MMQEQRLTGRTIATYLATYAGWLAHCAATIATYLATYAGWLAHCAAGIAICILWQQTLLLLYTRAGWNKYGVSAYNNLIVIVLVLGWLALCVGTEAWYRHGIANGTIGRRLLRVTLIEVAAAALAAVGGWLVVVLP